MSDRIERELLVPASREEVWDAVVHHGWLADEVDLDLRPGGDALFRSSDAVKSGWVEDVREPARLAFWWAADGEPATRVELTLDAVGAHTLLRVVETRPLEVLDLVGVPLPGIGGATLGPALVAA
ncbi:MAG TPA: SRPBCC domain-containing protein [Solirubrobacteraceae bacterium]|nr:SRPBCC domain-containing protein [Solirubrobacteraceae bacterium]